MKSVLQRWAGAIGLISASVVPMAAAANCPALLDHSFPGLMDGKPVNH
jgi:glutathione peroxidase